MQRNMIVTLAAALVAACGGKPDARAAADGTGRSIELPRADSTATLNDRPVPGAPPARVDTVFVDRATPPTRGPASRAASPPPASGGGRMIASTPAPPPLASDAPAPAPEPAPAPAPARAPAQLETGTIVVAHASRELTSRHDKAGATFTASIPEAIPSADGRSVIPAGSEVTFTIVEIKPAPDRNATDGTLRVRATSVTINGQSHPIDADVTSVEHSLKGRGVTGKEAVKVGAGAAAGAIVGKILGGGTGAAVGAVTGGAAGAAVAVETADRDVVVPVGARIKLVLRAVFAPGA